MGQQSGIGPHSGKNIPASLPPRPRQRSRTRRNQSRGYGAGETDRSLSRAVRIIGSGSALASATRAHTSTLFSFGGRPALLIDVGDGTSHALARLGLLPAEIPVVVLSHLHPDHAAGLPGYLQQLRLEPPPSTAQTPRLWLPPLAAERLPAALATFGFSEEKLGRLVRRECYGAGSTITLPGDARLKVLANEHLADSTLLGESDHALGTGPQIGGAARGITGLAL